jgi:DNA gyrase subunit A
MMVEDTDDLMIITREGMIIRQKVENIKTISRNTQGVRLINLSNDDKVNDITRIEAEPDDETIDREVEKLAAQSLEKPAGWDNDVAALEDEIDETEDMDIDVDTDADAEMDEIELDIDSDAEDNE